jgi:hypothetical protein
VASRPLANTPAARVAANTPAARVAANTQSRAVPSRKGRLSAKNAIAQKLKTNAYKAT